MAHPQDPVIGELLLRSLKGLTSNGEDDLSSDLKQATHLFHDRCRRLFSPSTTVWEITEPATDLPVAFSLSNIASFCSPRPHRLEGDA